MSDYSETPPSSRQKLVEDMKNVIADAEEILRATAGIASEKAAEIRERMSERLQAAKAQLAEAEALIVDKTKAAVRVTDEYVSQNPWQAVGIAAGVGFLLGAIIARR